MLDELTGHIDTACEAGDKGLLTQLMLTAYAGSWTDTHAGNPLPPFDGSIDEMRRYLDDRIAQLEPAGIALLIASFGCGSLHDCWMDYFECTRPPIPGGPVDPDVFRACRDALEECIREAKKPCPY